MAFKIICLPLIFFAFSASADETSKTNDTEFKTYELSVSIDSDGVGSVQKFRLPRKETDRFLSMFMSASVSILECETYKSSEINPLTRRPFSIEIEKKPAGCSLNLHEYRVWVYRCFITTQQAKTLSVLWGRASIGGALGARSQEEADLISEACDREAFGPG